MIRIHNAEAFTREIERMVAEDESSYLEAIMNYVQKNNIEVESVVRLINPVIKEKLRKEAHDLNLLGKKPTKLLFDGEEV